ncbi:MAG: pitrilysin family protein, partial [Propionicimonas sp.]|nr:pitrilysin family protein [Propionicimonas sp.]
MPLQYPVHTTTLDNGLRVVVSPDPAVPIVAVNLWYDVGSRDEQPGQTGWAHLFEHLMFQGSANVASGEHLNTLQNVGGSVNATTSFDRTNYFETVPTGALDLALWVEADRLASLADNLSQANVDTQREVVKEEKRQRYDNVPYGHAVRHLVELVFPSEHPYGHVTIGRMADLDAATPEAAQAFFGRHYQPENAVLSLVGDLTVREGFRRAEKAFGWIAGGERRPRTNTAPLPGLRGRPRQEILADVPADAVYLAWRLPARDSRRFDATDLALAVLGDGQSSRLQRVLVRERELAASASAGALGLIAGTSLGLASARALPGVSP